jgi:hypothetical protein
VYLAVLVQFLNKRIIILVTSFRQSDIKCFAAKDSGFSYIPNCIYWLESRWGGEVLIHVILYLFRYMILFLFRNIVVKLQEGSVIIEVRNICVYFMCGDIFTLCYLLLQLSPAFVSLPKPLIFFASGVGLSPLYCGHFWPIVPAPDNRWGWLWSNWWNKDWQGKPKYLEKTCPSAILSTTNPTWPDRGSNPGRPRGKPATNRLNYGAALEDPLTRRQNPQAHLTVWDVRISWRWKLRLRYCNMRILVVWQLRDFRSHHRALIAVLNSLFKL